MIFRNGAKASGLWSGWPVFGLRACRCTMAAPASAASTAASAISCGVTGKAFDIEGVWIAPVTAQVMMTLRLMFFAFLVARWIFQSLSVCAALCAASAASRSLRRCVSAAIRSGVGWCGQAAITRSTFGL